MAETLAITSPKLKLHGRWYDSPTSGKRTGWQGSTIHVAFTGTSLSLVVDRAVLQGADVYAYVDGADCTNNDIVNSGSPQTIVVASGLANTAHVARIQLLCANTYAVAKGAVYADVSAVQTDGAFSQWSHLYPNVRFIGDSISCIMDCYPAFVAGVTPVVVAHGGMCLATVAPEGGASPYVIPAATTFFPYKVMPNYVSPTTVGAGAIVQTDDACVATCVFFGTNDTSRGVTSAAFKTAMQNLIAQVRAYEGPTHPVVMVRPMYTNDSLNYGAKLAEIAAADANAHYLNTQSLWAAMTYSTWNDATHPDPEGSRLLASAVEATLDSLGVTTLPVASDFPVVGIAEAAPETITHIDFPVLGIAETQTGPLPSYPFYLDETVTNSVLRIA